MYLPVYNKLKTDESTYLMFATAAADYDRAFANKTDYYFTRLVSLLLPSKVTEDDLNELFPKVIQKYAGNICRNISRLTNSSAAKHVAEGAFNKTLKYFGYDDYTKYIKSITSFSICNYISDNVSNGWSELAGDIPGNVTKPINPELTYINGILTTNDGNTTDTEQIPIYDNASKQYVFSSNFGYLDFDSVVEDNTITDDFSFNLLLVFYKDSDGVEKLHGINFIGPWIKNGSNYYLKSYTHKYNQITQKFGYQFLFNIKTNIGDSDVKPQYITCNSEVHEIYNKLSLFMEDMNNYLLNTVSTASLASQVAEIL